MSSRFVSTRGSSAKFTASLKIAALFAVGTAGLATLPGAASASSTGNASSACSKIPPSKISSIVGFKVPAATSSTYTSPPTKANYEISATTTACTYGSETNLASLSKLVILDIETLSKPYTSTEFQQSLSKLAATGLKIKVTPFPGLGGNAFFFTETSAQVSAEGISVFNGVHGYGASVETTKLPTSKLAQLAQLASSL